MHGPCDVSDRVLRAHRSLNIGEEKDPAIGFKPVPEFSDNAGLAHTPLTGQQHMVAVTYLRFQYLQLAVAIEKVVADYPAACG